MTESTPEAEAPKPAPEPLPEHQDHADRSVIDGLLGDSEKGT